MYSISYSELRRRNILDFFKIIIIIIMIIYDLSSKLFQKKYFFISPKATGTLMNTRLQSFK